MTTKLFVILLIAFALLSVAQGHADGESSLKKIMQEMRADSALIVDGLLVDDHEAVAAAAAGIANHPHIPPEQVALVAAELGSEMAAFKQLDTLVHDLALSIHAAAKKGDSGGMAENYQKMLSGCLQCHALYRQRIAAVLNPQPEPE